MSNIRAPRRRRLTDLWMRGVELSLSDDSGEEPVQVWVSKITPIQRKTAGEKANHARAATLAFKNMPNDSEERLLYRDQMESLGLLDRDAMIRFLIAPEIQKSEAEHEAEVAASEAWSENDYIESLQGAWNDGLSEKYVMDPEDEEAKRVLSELKRFTEEVDALVEADTIAMERDYEDVDTDTLERRAIDKLIETEADINWILEFRRWQVFFCTRFIDDHSELFFDDRSEVDALDERVFSELFTAFTELTVDTTEGKG